MEATWRVVAPARLVILDSEIAARACRWPPLMESLLDRGLRRSRSLAVSAAIRSLRGIDERIRVLMWHLAEHWGKVEPDGGVIVPIDVTHETLGVLVGARRPTVSTALSRMAESGAIERVRGTGSRLRGTPPGPNLERH